jgi:hypothetical protein
MLKQATSEAESGASRSVRPLLRVISSLFPLKASGCLSVSFYVSVWQPTTAVGRTILMGNAVDKIKGSNGYILDSYKHAAIHRWFAERTQVKEEAKFVQRLDTVHTCMFTIPRLPAKFQSPFGILGDDAKLLFRTAPNGVLRLAAERVRGRFQSSPSPTSP